MLFLKLEGKTTYLLLRHHLKLACAIHSGCPCKIPKGGKRESNVWGHKKIAVTMLPLGLCRFKDRCYIKTARDHVQHQEKALKKIPLHSAPSRFFFFCVGGVVFLHVLPPRYWCRLAVSRSNNMAEWFSKNTVVAVRLFRGVTLEEADSLRLSGAAAPIALTRARWPTLPGVVAFPLCWDDKGNSQLRAGDTMHVQHYMLLDCSLSAASVWNRLLLLQVQSFASLCE